MSPVEILIEISDRLAANQDKKLSISESQLTDWSIESVHALKNQQLIKKSKSASSAICPGCERECVMPVHILTDTDQRTELFIVCDKRNDINRVEVKQNQLIQWQCNAELLCRFICESLAIRQTNQVSEPAHRWNVGVASGKKRSQMLCLQIEDFCELMAGSNTLPLADLIEFDGRAYSINKRMVEKLVDTAPAADHRHTPSIVRREARKLDTQAMYESWEKAYRKLIKEHPNKSDAWYSKKIAEMAIGQNRDAETIRKNMK